MKHEKYDVVVIGSGVGGMCVASLLSHAGYKTLVVEQLPQIGGRFSTIEYKGFKLGTGGTFMPMVGIYKGIFDEVGAEFELRPAEVVRCRINGRDFESPVAESTLLSELCENEAEAIRIATVLRQARSGERPSNQISIHDWLLQYTDNEKVLAYLEYVCPYAFCISAHEASAKAYFELPKEVGLGLIPMGFPPHGHITLWESLAKIVQGSGGNIRTRCKAERILVTDGTASGVLIEQNGKKVQIDAKVVISNAGPKNTINLAGSAYFDRDYLREVGNLRPGGFIKIEIASDRPLYDVPHLMTMQTRRMLDFSVLTLICPELAPPGKHLHVAHSFVDSRRDSCDLNEEVNLLVQDLRENLPAFSKYGEILHVGCYSGEWPVYHTVPFVGYNGLSEKTPVKNLYNVSDAVATPGWTGGAASARSATLVAKDIKKSFKPREA